MSELPLAQTLLSRAHSPTSASRIYTEKIKQRPLHLKPTTPSTPTSQTQRRLTRTQKLLRKKKQKPTPLSSREKRKLCLYDIPRSAQKYGIYKGLNEMWNGYILEILNMNLAGERREVTPQMAAVLCAADFHGAEIECVRCKCVSRVGVRGIVVKDSRGVFEVVTRGDRVKVLPKEGGVFRFWVRVPGSGKDEEGKLDVEGKGRKEEKDGEDKKGSELIFEIHGDQFMHRAADRANKKFKPHFLPNL